MNDFLNKRTKSLVDQTKVKDQIGLKGWSRIEPEDQEDLLRDADRFRVEFSESIRRACDACDATGFYRLFMNYRKTACVSWRM